MPLPSAAEAVGDGAVSGVTDGLAGAVVVFAPADAVAVGARLVQLAAGVGLLRFAVPDVLAGVADAELAGALAEALPLGLALPPGLALALSAALPLVPALPPGLTLALTLPLGLAVPLAWAGLAGLCGVLTLGLVGALVDAADCVGLAVPDSAGLAVCVADADGHVTAAALVFPGVALPSSLLVPGA